MAETTVSRDGRPQVATLVLPPLMRCFSILLPAVMLPQDSHVSLVILWFLIFLSLLASLLVGYAMGSATHRNWLHMILFALIISSTLYIIFDFEYPRHGIIQMDKADHIYISNCGIACSNKPASLIVKPSFSIQFQRNPDILHRIFQIYCQT